MHHESSMMAFAKLAELSHDKQQLPQRDKFLLLTAEAACNAGWPEIAERCRGLVLKNTPSHSVRRFDSFVEAMRNDDYQSLQRQLKKFCTYERAEHLLQELQVDFSLPDSQSTVGEAVLVLLEKMSQ